MPRNKAKSVLRPDMKVTLDGSDWHYGDAGQLHESLIECMGRAIPLVRNYQAAEVEVIVNGDAVAGRGIFRDQGMQSAVQFGSEQCWFAAHDIAAWQSELHASRWVLVKGNHDQANKENLTAQLVCLLRLLGVPAVYARRTYTANLSPDDEHPYWADVQHGFGNSSYYANSYESIRECWRLYIERVKVDQIDVSRFLRAHTHWLNVGQTVGLDVAIDTTGGWHRQERDKLPSDTRQTGVLIYAHDGKELAITPVMADRKLLTKETYDVGLHYATMAAAASALQVMSAWAHAQGLG